MMEHDVDISSIALHDRGDLVEYSLEDMGETVQNAVSDIVGDGKFPLLIGGEHSITPHAVSAYDEVDVLILDAHLDYRDSYEGLSNSHATVSKRVSEIISGDLLVCGVRSISSDEIKGGRLPAHLSAKKILSMEHPEESIKNSFKSSKIYLSIDMDVVDPAFAPGVGNPEPFGLKPVTLKNIIDTLANKLVGFDVVEVSPPYDKSGITSNLASRLIYEVLGAREGQYTF